jgi:two-component system response regulator FixJ
MVSEAYRLSGAGAPEIVHIIDDEAEIRRSLVEHAEAAGHQAIAHPSAEAFLDDVDFASAGCVVTDVRMPGMGGLQLLERVRASAHGVPVIIMTAHGDVPMAVEALKSGALDFIEKPFPGASFRRAVAKALESRRAAFVRELELRSYAERRARLTGREAEIMDFVVSGQSNLEIADALGISVRTVENHRARVMDKMQARSLTELVRMALAAGDEV